MEWVHEHSFWRAMVGSLGWTSRREIHTLFLALDHRNRCQLKFTDCTFLEKWEMEIEKNEFTDEVLGHRYLNREPVKRAQSENRAPKVEKARGADVDSCPEGIRKQLGEKWEAMKNYFSRRFGMAAAFDRMAKNQLTVNLEMYFPTSIFFSFNINYSIFFS